jgi:hypothetical protein
MSVLRRKCLFIVTISVTILAFVQSPSAQNSGTAGRGKQVPAPAVSAAADKKAADAMLNLPASAPADADRKAAAAMGASKPAK